MEWMKNVDRFLALKGEQKPSRTGANRGPPGCRVNPAFRAILISQGRRLADGHRPAVRAQGNTNPWALRTARSVERAALRNVNRERPYGQAVQRREKGDR